jgi:hypothetical protein
MNTSPTAVTSPSELRHAGLSIFSLLSSAGALFAIITAGAIMVFYDGAKNAPETIIPIVAACFMVFYGGLFLGVVTSVYSLVQTDRKINLTYWAFALIGAAMLIAYILFLIYD